MYDSGLIYILRNNDVLMTINENLPAYVVNKRKRSVHF